MSSTSIVRHFWNLSTPIEGPIATSDILIDKISSFFPFFKSNITSSLHPTTSPDAHKYLRSSLLILKISIWVTLSLVHVKMATTQHTFGCNAGSDRRASCSHLSSAHLFLKVDHHLCHPFSDLDLRYHYLRCSMPPSMRLVVPICTRATTRLW